jgi:hypothetical protein
MRLARYRNWVKVGLILLGTTLLAQFCSTDGVAKKHERLCRQHGTVVVDDDVLWRQYRAQAKLAFQSRRAKWGLDTGRMLFEPVGGFREAYGENAAPSRPEVGKSITRNDIAIFKGKTKVAHAVDYIYSYQTLTHRAFFTCLMFDNLYNEGMSPL